MGKFKDLQVGDKVWLQSQYRNGYSRYLTVSKRGRKYITFDALRVIRASVGSDVAEEPGYGSIGTLYESQEQYLLHVERRKEKQKLLEKLVPILRDQSLETLRAIDELIEQTKDGKA